MRKFEIDERTLSAILQYLLSRPMGEVEAGVNALRNLKEIVDEVQDASS